METNTSLSAALERAYGSHFVSPEKRERVLRQLLDEAYGQISSLQSRLRAYRSGVMDELEEQDRDGSAAFADAIEARWNIRLTRQELALLDVLRQCSPRVVGRFHLLECLPARNGGDGSERVLKLPDVLVTRIRKKTQFEAIDTVWGSGWKLGQPMLELVQELKAPALSRAA